MKKILFSAAIVSLCLGTAFAQQKVQTTQTDQTVSKVNQQRQNFQKRTPEDIAKMKTERLNKMVQLTDAQKGQVQAIYLKEAQTNQQKMTQRKETQSEIQSVLTADQAAKLKTQRQEQMNKMKENRGKWQRQQAQDQTQSGN